MLFLNYVEITVTKTSDQVFQSTANSKSESKAGVSDRKGNTMPWALAEDLLQPPEQILYWRLEVGT